MLFLPYLLLRRNIDHVHLLFVGLPEEECPVGVIMSYEKSQILISFCDRTLVLSKAEGNEFNQIDSMLRGTNLLTVNFRHDKGKYIVSERDN